MYVLLHVLLTVNGICHTLTVSMHMCYCMCCWQLMTSVTHWQSVRISTVSVTCKTIFYLFLSSIRTTIHQLAATYKCENASLLTVCSQCLYLLFASCLTLTTALSCHWMYSSLCWSMALSFSSTFAWHKITSSPFQTLSICLYSNQFRLQHHTVKSQCNHFQWKTFTVWRVNLKKLSSETPLNSEVQIYRHFEESAASIIKVALLLPLKWRCHNPLKCW